MGISSNQPRDLAHDQARDLPRETHPRDLPRETHPRGRDPLDGLRGLAALHVTIHHYNMEWGRWNEAVLVIQGTSSSYAPLNFNATAPNERENNLRL